MTMYANLGLPDGFDQQYNPFQQPQRRPPTDPRQQALQETLEQPPTQGFTPRTAAPPQAPQAPPRAPQAVQTGGLQPSAGTAASQMRAVQSRVGQPPRAASAPRPTPVPGAPDPHQQAALQGLLEPEDPVEPPSQLPPEAPPIEEPPSSGGDYQAKFREIMAPFGYGPEALIRAQDALRAAGFDLQIDSSGRGRGRIRLPDGRLVDVHSGSEGITEGDNWFNNLRGTDWGWQDRGQHPLGDAGWSFDGAGYGGSSGASGGSSAPWESRNQQMGGDALQVIYQMLGPLFGQIFQGQALRGALGEPE
jgi:hypothetical protein